MPIEFLDMPRGHLRNNRACHYRQYSLVHLLDDFCLRGSQEKVFKASIADLLLESHTKDLLPNNVGIHITRKHSLPEQPETSWRGQRKLLL